MGAVFYAIELELRVERALKCLRVEFAQKPDVVERFRNEAKTQARLNHPNIAHLYEYFQAGGEHFIAMEYVNGDSLAKTLQKRGRIPYDEAVEYTVQALRGLEHAHRHGIIHRDIKPANLILTQDNQIKVADFGIARVIGSARETRVGSIVGTFEYISPEAVEGKETTVLSDVYSIGIVLYELIAGQLPFNSQSEYELVGMHVRAARPSIRKIVKEVPVEIDDAIQKAMDRSPRKRFSSAGEMADVLEQILARLRRKGTSSDKTWWPFTRDRGSEPREERPLSATGVTDRRRVDVSTANRRVEDLLSAHQYAEAQHTVDALEREYGEDPELKEIRTRIRRQWQTFQDGVQQNALLVRDLLGQGHADAALRAARNALGIYPGARELLAAESDCLVRKMADEQTSGELVEAEGRVEEFIAGELFNEATEFLLELKDKLKGQADIGSLLTRVLQARKDHERQRAIREAVDQTDALIQNKQWPEAFEVVGQAMLRYAGDPQLLECRQNLENRQKAERKVEAVRGIVDEVRRLEGLGAVAKARETLMSGLGLFADEAELQTEFVRLEAAIASSERAARIKAAIASATQFRAERRWQKAFDVLDAAHLAEGADDSLAELRAISSAELRAHLTIVERILSQGRELIDQLRWEEAVLRLSAAVRDLPGEKGLAELLQFAQRGLGAKRRADTIARLRTQADDHIGKNEFEQAVEILLDAVSRYPDDGQLSQDLSNAIVARDLDVARQKVAKTLGDASILQLANEWAKSIETLQLGLAEVPDDLELRKALDDAEQRWRSMRREEMLRAVSARIDEHVKGNQFDRVNAVFEEALSEWPGDVDLLSLQGSTHAEVRRFNAEKAMAAALEIGSKFEREGLWGLAAEEYERAILAHSAVEAQLGPKAKFARQREYEDGRRTRLAEFEKEFESRITGEQFADARLILEEIRLHFADEPKVSQWQEEVDQRQQAAERSRILGDLETKVGELLSGRQFAESKKAVREAGECVGEDAFLDILISRIGEEEQVYLQAIEQAEAEVLHRLDLREWDEAATLARLYGVEFREDPRFHKLYTTAIEERDKERRDREIKQRESQIRVLLSEEKWNDAAVLVRRALRDFEAEPIFRELETMLSVAELAAGRREAFARDQIQVEALFRCRNWEQSQKILDSYLAFPEIRPKAEALLQQLEEQKAAHQNRINAINESVRQLLAAENYDQATKVLGEASLEFPDVHLFGHLRSEALEKSSTAIRLKRLEETQDKILTLLANHQLDESRTALVCALEEFPQNAQILELQSMLQSLVDEESAVSSTCDEVRQLIDKQRVNDADRVLIEGFRKYPTSQPLNELRPIVESARQAEWEQRSGEAARQRAELTLTSLLEQYKLDEARALVAALERDYGIEFAKDAMQLVESAAHLLQEIRRLIAMATELCYHNRWGEAAALLRSQPIAVTAHPDVAQHLASIAQEKAIDALLQAHKIDEARQVVTLRVTDELTPAFALKVESAARSDEQVIEEVLEGATKLCDAAQWTEAAALLSRQPGWISSDTRVVQCQQAIAHGREIERLLRESRQPAAADREQPIAPGSEEHPAPADASSAESQAPLTRMASRDEATVVSETQGQTDTRLTSVPSPVATVPKLRLPLVAFGAILLIGLGLVGVQRLKEPAQIGNNTRGVDLAPPPPPSLKTVTPTPVSIQIVYQIGPGQEWPGPRQVKVKVDPPAVIRARVGQGSNWLKATVTGTDVVNVAAVPLKGMTAGTYRGSVVISVPGVPDVSIPVSFVIKPFTI